MMTRGKISILLSTLHDDFFIITMTPDLNLWFSDVIIRVTTLQHIKKGMVELI
jgi:hypothetical protein